MKYGLVFCVCILMPLTGLAAQSPDPVPDQGSITSILDVNGSLASYVGTGTNYMLIELTVMGSRIVNGEAGSFLAEVDMVEAFWQGRNTLVRLPAILLCRGEGFRSWFEAPDERGGGPLMANYRKILVLVRPEGSRSVNGRDVPVLLAIDARRN